LYDLGHSCHPMVVMFVYYQKNNNNNK